MADHVFSGYPFSSLTHLHWTKVLPDLPSKAKKVLPFRKSVPAVYWNNFSCMFIQVAWSGYAGSRIYSAVLKSP